MIRCFVGVARSPWFGWRGKFPSPPGRPRLPGKPSLPGNRRFSGSPSPPASHKLISKILEFGMRIGVDFDNTLIDYDRVFLDAAGERGLIGAGFEGSKRAVRDAIRLLPGGELTWQRLQGHVYGAGIQGAVPFAGAGDFLRRCRTRGLTVFIVSHKTRYGRYDPARVDLRQAALGWMTAQGFLDTETGCIPAEQVFFEDDRPHKLARIAALRCTHFIDDLEEVFADPGFPPGTTRILFAPTGAACCDVHCSTWAEIAAAIFGDDG
jgi:hypothetical protein